MGHFVVTRDAGSGWTAGKGAFEQPSAPDHAAFMNQLAEDGFVVFAGPLAGTEAGRVRVLLIVDAETEDEVRDTLCGDPWAHSEQLVTRSVETWLPIVGAERLAAIS